MGIKKAARNKYIGSRVRKQFREGLFQGVVTEVSGALETKKGVERRWFFHIKCAWPFWNTLNASMSWPVVSSDRGVRQGSDTWFCLLHADTRTVMRKT